MSGILRVMAMNPIRDQLLRIFIADEPEYERAAALGPAALPVLREMVDEKYEVAASAVYVAALLAEHESLEIISRAARRDDEVRIHAAYALETFMRRAKSPGDLDVAAEILAPLLDDADPDTRRFAQRAAAALPDGAHHHAGRNAGS